MYHMANDKKIETVVSNTSEVKEMNKISEEIFRLFDKLIEDYKIKMDKNEEFKEDDRINGNEQFKKILNLSVQIYNIYITNQNENKDKLKPIDKNQIIELETNFQEEYIINYRAVQEVLQNNTITSENEEEFQQIKKMLYVIFLTTILRNLLKLFEEFKDEEDSNVKDSENKVFIKEFLERCEKRATYIISFMHFPSID